MHNPHRPLIVIGLLCLLNLGLTSKAYASCSAPSNAIEAENCLPGNSSDEWDIIHAGDPSIQGFATDISYNVGSTVNFKINTDASAYNLVIYRMGYYSGMGARKIATLQPSAQLPQSQPPCVTDTTVGLGGSGLADCGNWAVSASWQIPNTAVSGIYFALLTRPDTGGQSHIVFHSPQRRGALQYSVSDFGHYLAGIQLLRPRQRLRIQQRGRRSKPPGI